MSEPPCKRGRNHDWFTLGTSDAGETVSRCNHCLTRRFVDERGAVRYVQAANQKEMPMSLKCTSCGDEKATVGEIRGCPRCKRQGVVAQIPATLADDVRLARVVHEQPALGNRFISAGATPEAEPLKASEAAEPEKAPAKQTRKRGR